MAHTVYSSIHPFAEPQTWSPFNEMHYLLFFLFSIFKNYIYCYERGRPKACCFSNTTCRTFSQRITNDWNVLRNTVVESKTIDQFKSQVDNFWRIIGLIRNWSTRLRINFRRTWGSQERASRLMARHRDDDGDDDVVFLFVDLWRGT